MKEFYGYCLIIYNGIAKSEVVSGEALDYLYKNIMSESVHLDHDPDNYNIDGCDMCKKLLYDFIKKYEDCIDSLAKEEDEYVKMLEILGITNRFKMTKSARKL